MSETEQIPEPAHWQYPEKSPNAGYIKMYSVEENYMQLHTDVPVVQTVEYFFNEDGVPAAYRSRTATDITLMPDGDLRRYMSFSRVGVHSPVVLWFSSRLNRANDCMGVDPSEEIMDNMGWLSWFRGQLHTVSLGKFFIGNVSYPEIIWQLYHQNEGIGSIDLFLNRSHEGLRLTDQYYDQRAQKGNFPDPKIPDEYLQHKFSWEVKNGFFTIKQVHNPGTESEITKIIRAPLKINQSLLEQVAFEEAPVSDPRSANWPHIDSIIPAHISFSGPGFPRFMGMKEDV
jgi:hypothetical protein